MRDEDLNNKGLPHDKRRKPISAAEHAASDDFIDELPSQFGEAAAPPDEETPNDDVFWLLEENARLRSLAVKLSALVGDLSEREWCNALAAADLATLHRVRSPRAPERAAHRRRFGGGRSRHV